MSGGVKSTDGIVVKKLDAPEKPLEIGERIDELPVEKQDQPVELKKDIDPEKLRPSHVDGASKKVLSEAPVEGDEKLTTYDVRLARKGRDVHVQVRDDGGQLISQSNLGKRRKLGISPKDIKRLNERFKDLQTTELADVVGDVAAALHNLEHVADHHASDPLVKNADEKVDKKTPRAETVAAREKTLRKRGVAVEGIGHITTPTILHKVAAALHNAHVYEAVADALHVASQGLHAFIGVVDGFMALNELRKDDPNKAVIGFHGARAALSLLSIQFPVLGTAIILMTLGKIAFDMHTGMKATELLDASIETVGDRVHDLIAEYKAERGKG